MRLFLSRIRSPSIQSQNVCGSSLRTNSTFTLPILSHITDTSRRQCASNASAGAGSIIKVVCNTFGSRAAGAFQETLASEAQSISTESMPYDDLESTSRYPTIKSQPILLGFSLPPYYFSYTASAKFVVDVFCQLVSFVHDHQAWDHYVTGSISTDYSALVSVRVSSPISSFCADLDVKIFRDLERSLTRDENLNRDLLRSLGAPICADLVKVSRAPVILYVFMVHHLGAIGIVS